MTEAYDAPVITIDGPSGVGKGALLKALQEKLAWHALDSGAIYRCGALLLSRAGVNTDADDDICKTLEAMEVRFEHDRVWLNNEDVTASIRNEECATLTSHWAALPCFRSALLEQQRLFRCLPGLLADGRDMGTHVFPDALCKIYLTASPKVRAERRRKQLLGMGIDVNLCELEKGMESRDKRDSQRKVTPLLPADDALIVDNSNMTIDETVEHCLAYVKQFMELN